MRFIPTALLLVSCGDPQVARDAADEGAATWRVETVWQVGGSLAEGPEALGTPISIAVDAASRVYVLQRAEQEIAVFDSAGQWVRTIGRRGQGPAEFTNALGMAFGPDGTLWVVDARNHRYTNFDTSGTFVTTVIRPFVPLASVWMGRFADDSILLDHTRLMTGRELYIAFDPSTQTVGDTVFLPDTSQAVHAVSQTQGTTRMILQMRIPFAPAPLHAPAPDKSVWVAMSDRYDIVRLGPAGDTLARAERSWTPVPLSASERDSVLTLLRRMPGEPPSASLIPTTKPALARITTDPDGNLWVLPEGSAGLMHVFTPHGTPLAIVETPITNVFPGNTLVVGRVRITWASADSLGTAVISQGIIERH